MLSPAWVDIDSIVVYANGEVQDTVVIPDQATEEGRAVDDENTVLRTYSFDTDTVLVAEAFGDEDLFPMITPREPLLGRPCDLTEGVARSLGLADALYGPGDGVRSPSRYQRITPYALTNPIWLDIDGDGDFNPPGVSGL